MKNSIAVLALSCSALAAFASPAVTNKSTALQSGPQSDAAALATLAENTKVEVLRSQGAWRQVKAGAQTGWVYMFDLKLEADAGAQRKALSVKTSNDSTVSTGTRGLTAEDLKNAEANPAEFKKMQGYTVAKPVGQAFAKKTGLSPASIEYRADQGPARTEQPSFQGG
jgi:hypothetical protein